MWSGTTPAGNSTVNGLNQTVSAPGTALAYDGRGNLTTVGGVATYGYDAANRLTSAAGVATLSYDPLGRLYQVSDGATTRFGYDGGEIVLETDGSNAVLRRYVKGTGADETIAWYEGAGTSSRRWLMEDERGSVVAVADDTGAAIAINTYDEYGRPGAGNLGRFQYTGQAYIASLGLYTYKARFYAPSLGKFLQPDPIGYAGGMNLYAYVGGDPVNWNDPSGLKKDCPAKDPSCSAKEEKVNDGDNVVMVWGHRPQRGMTFSYGGRGWRVDTVWQSGPTSYDITVVGDRAPRYSQYTGYRRCFVGCDLPEGFHHDFDPIGEWVSLVVQNGVLLGVGMAVTPVKLAATAGEAVAVDANKLVHIFGNARQDLGPLTLIFGSQEVVFAAVQSAAQSAVRSQSLSGVFETTVNVAGQNVVVRGKVIDGVARIGTFFIP